jgi:hypothetical protein
VALIGRTVTLLYHESDPTRVELFSNGTSQGMCVPLDVHVNAKIKRDRPAVEPVPEREYLEERKRYQAGCVFEREEP